MSNGNGEQVTKKCPFLQQACIRDGCALYMEFTQSVGGVKRKMGTCVFVGTNIILSEMNTHLQQQGKQPVPQIVIPGMGRG